MYTQDEFFEALKLKEERQDRVSTLAIAVFVSIFGVCAALLAFGFLFALS